MKEIPDLKILRLLDEQISVKFTGKLNLLSRENRQFLGQVSLKDGEIYNAQYFKNQGLKAFYQIILSDYALDPIDYVIEPEMVTDAQRHIHYPFYVLRNRIAEVIEQHTKSLKFKPPKDIRILVDAEFMEDIVEVTPEEFDLLEVITEWNKPEEIYHECKLLDFEITLALVSLRKKAALKIIGDRND